MFKKKPDLPGNLESSACLNWRMGKKIWNGGVLSIHRCFKFLETYWSLSRIWFTLVLGTHLFNKYLRVYCGTLSTVYTVLLLYWDDILAAGSAQVNKAEPCKPRCTFVHEPKNLSCCCRSGRIPGAMRAWGSSFGATELWVVCSLCIFVDLVHVGRLF